MLCRSGGCDTIACVAVLTAILRSGNPAYLRPGGMRRSRLATSHTVMPRRAPMRMDDPARGRQSMLAPLNIVGLICRIGRERLGRLQSPRRCHKVVAAVKDCVIGFSHSNLRADLDRQQVRLVFGRFNSLA